ncbi:SIR2 family protein [Candidatus Accumulibacter sp. ACC005]|uniref:SIR2 family protein n=1 Tax=Candidatus Accumulibacter sp. ACC005 TaxID=2823331 RepID=UPI0025BDC2C4|nr:SIR2 family protein [Candidatus Accumulibacter sp. ACC005]
MADLLLLGAGFSRNWGGWLATEAFEYLLGCPEVTSNPRLGELLWRHQPQGGFEAALAELQGEYSRNPRSCEAALMGLQAAVSGMFADMNGAFMESTQQTFQNCVEHTVGTFLTRFDAIFTLNQDVLLEHFYGNDNITLTGKKQWAGAQLPGMQRVPAQEPMHHDSWARSTWNPLPQEAFKVDPGCQPIFKLHGSSNWARADGSRLLIMGGQKAREIGQTPILNWYADEFEKSLSAQPSRLMVIGYGFRDDHINAVIGRASEQGLKLFVICPEGADVARRLNSTRERGAISASTPLEGILERSLIGASRRQLRDIFGGDTAEHNKVMRFFEA